MMAPPAQAEARARVRGIGLIIIGSEILNGRRTDRHFLYCRDLFLQRGYALQFALTLPDEPAVIDAHLRWAMEQPHPFFCCGGIGATPDDYTRDCAARAAGTSLGIHPEGEAILKQRWGQALTPIRLRLVEFPVGSALIPNPVNQVPGFSIANGHFVPGFPEMAQPMIAWVLDHWYQPAEVPERHTLLLPGAREGELIPIMERFVATFPDCDFSSLPRFTGDGGTEVELSLSGLSARATEARTWLTSALGEAGFRYVPVP